MGQRVNSIYFYSQQVKVNLKYRRLLKKFLLLIFQNEHQPLTQLRYIFCTDKYLLEINQKFLNHDALTDIITFNLSDDPAITEGEIYISLERVRENATIFQ